MSDIVGRLRRHQANADCGLQQKTMEDAADEIERLRDTLAETEGARVLNANALRLAKEKIEWLRRLLREIADYSGDSGVVERVREALGEQYE